MKTNKTYDAIILGGSYAGLSAAMSLGRSLRNVLIIDNGKPCNRQTPHSHNFLTQDGKTPAEISTIAREQVAQYDTIEFLADTVVSAELKNDIIDVKCESNTNYIGKNLVIASGIRDIMPDIPGFAESWGISVIHCPYCHGYEFRGKRTGIFVTDAAAALHQSGLVKNLTPDVTLFTDGKQFFDEEQLADIKRREIAIVTDKIKAIDHNNGILHHLHMDSGNSISLDALYARVPFDLHHDIAQQLGCAMTDQGLIQVDGFQKTTVPKVYACGDNSSPVRAVASAVYTGNLAGAIVNMALCEL